MQSDSHACHVHIEFSHLHATASHAYKVRAATLQWNCVYLLSWNVLQKFRLLYKWTMPLQLYCSISSSFPPWQYLSKLFRPWGKCIVVNIQNTAVYIDTPYKIIAIL